MGSGSSRRKLVDVEDIGQRSQVPTFPPVHPNVGQNVSANAKNVQGVKFQQDASSTAVNKTPETAKTETTGANATLPQSSKSSENNPELSKPPDTTKDQLAEKSTKSPQTPQKPKSFSPEKVKMESKSETEKKAKSEENMLPAEPDAQRKFDTTLRSSCLLVKPNCVMKHVDKNITRLQLNQALPSTYSVFNLVKQMDNLQVLDLSNNRLGSQGFRAVCLALCSNSTIISLNLAGNNADTDSAESVGRLLTLNKTLEYLDVSSNNLGKDYFSRCVGPALKSNTSLSTLRAQSIGSTDLRLLLENLAHNASLTELDVSSNSLSNRTSLGAGMAAWLKSGSCSLSSLAVSNCDISPAGLTQICEALTHNSTLIELNLNGNEFGSLQLVAKFITTAGCHGNLRNLHINDAKVKDQTLNPQEFPDFSAANPALSVMSLHSSNISNALFTELKNWAKGRQLPLTDVDITNNSSLTASCIGDLIKLTSGESGKSSLCRLTFGMANIDGLAQELNLSCLPCLTYLNIRKAKVASKSLQELIDVCLSELSQVSTLVLDGLKLAGTEVLKDLGGKLIGSKVTTLSFGGSSLADGDLLPICDLLKKGHPLQMLKLSANRISDVGVTSLAEALMIQKSHPLAVLDLSNNTIGNEGAEQLSHIYKSKSHKTSLHSVNLAANSIGAAGVTSLVSVISGTSSLKSLYLNDQRDAISEAEMEGVFEKLSSSLGFKYSKTGNEIHDGMCELPPLPDGMIINLRNLGGQPGLLGHKLHSRCIVTDMGNDILTGLTLSGVLQLVAGLQGLDSEECVLSSEDWGRITGSQKDREVPSWLQLSSHRSRAVYVCNLPGNASVQKMEGMLEMEADCSVDEVVLMKDPVTRSNNGVGWVLFSDEQSVKKAVDFYLQGQAKIFGHAFSISTIHVRIDDEKNSELEAKAKLDQEARSKVRRQEDAAHRALIQQNTEESWKRHAYRLAHPAYADGRIW